MINAVILAGENNDSRLKDYSPNKALLEINGKYMIEYVLEVLEEIEEIEKIVVVGPEDLLNHLIKGKLEKIVPCTDSLVQNAVNGMNYFSEDKMILILSCDIPMITPEAIRDFLAQTAKVSADFYYPIIDKEANDKKYPGVKRTYVKLKDGTFTGGNIILVNPATIKKVVHKTEEFLENRKKPLKLAAALGWNFVIKLILGKLTVAELEKRVSELLGIKPIAIFSDFPEIGTDVDKPSDFSLARKVLGSKIY